VVEPVARTLVDVMRYEEDERELSDAASALEGHLRWLADHHRFAVVADMLQALRNMVTPAKTARSTTAADLLNAFAH
jgi:hypothetical protein